VVQDSRGGPAGAIGVGAPAWCVTGEVGVTMHGGHGGVKVWCGPTPSLWSGATRKEKEEVRLGSCTLSYNHTLTTPTIKTVT